MRFYQTKPEDSYRHKGLRRALVKELASKGIKDQKVLDAIEKIPRHFFFDSAFLEQAYKDHAFPIGQGQTISQPYTVARQTELLEIEPGMKILEIGTGSGYQCCVLLALGAEVHTIEVNQVLFERTQSYLPLIGFQAKFYLGDGTLGLSTSAPFDRIIVTAGAPVVPESLKSQLKPGGLLVIPVGNTENQKMLRIKRKDENTFEEESFGIFSFVKLIGAQGW